MIQVLRQFLLASWPSSSVATAVLCTRRGTRNKSNSVIAVRCSGPLPETERHSQFENSSIHIAKSDDTGLQLDNDRNLSHLHESQSSEARRRGSSAALSVHHNMPSGPSTHSWLLQNDTFPPVPPALALELGPELVAVPPVPPAFIEPARRIKIPFPPCKRQHSHLYPRRSSSTGCHERCYWTGCRQHRCNCQTCWNFDFRIG